MNSELLETFRSQAEELFLFLSYEHGFTGPQLTIDERLSLTTITFKKRNLAVQLIFDERGEDIDCKVARVISGRVTECYARDETGALVRESIVSILSRKGVRSRLFTNVSGISLGKRILITLEDFARMLREYGEDILNDSPSVFD